MHCRPEETMNDNINDNIVDHAQNLDYDKGYEHNVMVVDSSSRVSSRASNATSDRG